MNQKDHRNPHQNDEHQQLNYFLPGQVILHLEHTPDLNPDQLAEHLKIFLLEKDQKRSWKQALIPPAPDSFLTFPIQHGENIFSFIPTSLANEDLDQKELIKLLFDIFHVGQGEPILISESNGQRATLNAVFPNWLVGGGIHGIGVSGPGAWPKEAEVESGMIAQFFEEGEKVEDDPENGSGFQIAILDTAPCLSELAGAYEKWRKDKDGSANSNGTASNCLIDSLLHPGGPLQIYPATLDELRLAAPYISSGHPYSMPDHGLFVAGIIHSLAPNAAIHLYEVLNPNGAGCVLNVFKGLIKALKLRGDQSRLIINCSLVLGLFREDIPNTEHLWASLESDLLADFLNYLRNPIQQIFDLLASENVIVIAAAGNDGEENPGGNPPIIRPAARYPAAFKNVIGVGSTRRRNQNGQVKTASYSNLAGDPASEGYVILGGEEGADQGILGAFISQIPEYNGPAPRAKRNIRPDHVTYKSNNSGWVWWAGTSFAAPIVSGLVAKWWNIGDSDGLTRALSILDKFAGNNKSTDGEKMILVDQKPSPSGFC